MTEWLQPWLHYIPVSQLYNEIYNIHAFFSGPSPSMLAASNATRGTFQQAGLTTRRLDGDAELRKIASAGREWMFKYGRKIDMESEFRSQHRCTGADYASLRVSIMSRVGQAERR